MKDRPIDFKILNEAGESGIKWDAANQNERAPIFLRQQVKDRTEWGWSVERISEQLAISVDDVLEYQHEISKLKANVRTSNPEEAKAYETIYGIILFIFLILATSVFLLLTGCPILWVPLILASIFFVGFITGEFSREK